MVEAQNNNQPVKVESTSFFDDDNATGLAPFWTLLDLSKTAINPNHVYNFIKKPKEDNKDPKPITLGIENYNLYIIRNKNNKKKIGYVNLIYIKIYFIN